jgi:hypothetical protein
VSQRRLAVLGILEIETDAPLATLRVAEEHGVLTIAHADVATGFALARGFDLDHLGTLVGHHQGQLRSREKLRQVDDAQALELHVIPRSRSCAISFAS